jgi:hypothetical protein
MALASEQRLKGHPAAHTSWAKTEDGAARTAPARAALDKRFLDEAGGDPCAPNIYGRRTTNA